MPVSTVINIADSFQRITKAFNFIHVATILVWNYSEA